MTFVPRGAGAVMARRIEPPSSLDFFPTPPWATRALCEHVLFDDGWYAKHLFEQPIDAPAVNLTCWEPACGEGHMVAPLKEYFYSVVGTDVHDYGRGFDVGSFTGFGTDRAVVRFGSKKPDWIISNPPFKLGTEFIERALEQTGFGVAMFMRSVFIESAERFALFKKHPLTVFAPFAERVCLTKGRWDPKGSTATSYAWFVWIKAGTAARIPRVVIIPPGRKAALTKPEDITQFALEAAA